MALYPLAQVEEKTASMGGRGMTYKEASKAFGGVTVQEWISVKDRLPEPTYCVLVVGAYSEMAIDALGTDGEWMGMVEDITHWMPLPKPPKGE